MISGNFKKGQVTIFIAIGVVILLFAIILYFADSKVVSPKGNLVEVPDFARPVYTSLDYCLESVADDGLKKLGLQGGYLYPDSFMIRADSSNSVEGNALKLGSLTIPLWFYLDGNDCPNGECIYRIGIPPESRGSGDISDSSMEAQLDRYLEEFIPECFEKHIPSGFNYEEMSDIDVISTITSEMVIFSMNWKILVSDNSGKEVVFEDFATIRDVPLDEIYEAAFTIASLEAEESFLERSALQLISAYTGDDNDLLPPISQSSLSLSNGASWSEEQVKNKVEALLSNHVPLLTQTNTLNYYEVKAEDEFVNYYYNNPFTLPVAPVAAAFDVTFDYLPEIWPFWFDLGCDGLCKGESVSIFGVFPFGYQRYRFFYDFSYPVLVTLYSPDSDYTFQFAIESNVRNNKPLLEGYSEPIVVPSTTENLFCSDANRHSGDVNISVTQGDNHDPVSDVAVSFTIGDKSCIVGSTDNNGNLLTKFPVGFGGVVSFSKQNYAFEKIPFSIDLDEEKEINVTMRPFNDVNISVKKYIMMYEGGEWVFKFENKAYLESSEEVFLRLDGDSGTYGSYLDENGNGDLFIPEGDYHVSIMVMDSRPFVIPEYEECFQTGWFGSKECFTINKTEINDSVLVGGSEFNFSLSADTKNIEFYAIVPSIYDIPESQRKIEILDVMTDSKNISNRYYDYLEPMQK